MAMVSSKHIDSRGYASSNREFYPTFDGGLNLSVPNESLAKNELKEALNVEFSHGTGALTVRGGLVWSGNIDGGVNDVVPIPGERSFLVLGIYQKRLSFFSWSNIWGISEKLTGTTDFSIAQWDDYYLISSGKKLQKFYSSPPPRLETISTSLDSKFVFVREGRVGVVYREDTIVFSGLGDCTVWPTLNSKGELENNPNDPMDAQFIEIGYKDGMKIDAIVPLSKDLIIFKSPKNEPDKGTIWRLTGDFPDWQVLEVAHNTGTFSQKSVRVVGNDIFYLTPSGLAMLSTVTQYGEVRTSWPDRKVSKALVPLLRSSAKLWDVTNKQQLWILPSDDQKLIWVFDYTKGIWTQFTFPRVVKYVIEVDNLVYLIMDWDATVSPSLTVVNEPASICRLCDGYSQDEVKLGEIEDIVAKVRLGTILSGWQTLIKGIYASFYIMPQCKATLILDKFKMDFVSGVDVDYIYGDPSDPPWSGLSNYSQEACNDNDPLFQEGGVMTSRMRCLVREWAITPEIEFKGGCSAISTLALERVEV